MRRTPKTKATRRTWLGLAACAALTSCGPWAAAVASDKGAATKPFGPMDVFRLSEAEDPQIRPDGGAVAYVRVTNDIMTDTGLEAIWLVDSRSGAQSPLRGVAAETSQPRWSPDGGHLAFVAEAKTGGEAIYVRSMGSGRARRVAVLPRAPSSLAWSRDGRRIAFIMRAPAPREVLGAPLSKPPGAKWAEPLRLTTRGVYRKDGQGDLPPGYTHVFVAPVDGGVVRQVTSGSFDDSGPISWDLSGESLVFTSRRDEDWEREPFRSSIFRVALRDGGVTRLVDRQGPYGAADVSPDGGWIAFSGFDDERRRSYDNRRIYVMHADGRGLHQLGADFDRSLDHPKWSADGRSVYAGYDDRGVTKLMRLTVEGGGMRTVAEGASDGGLDLPYTGGEFSLAGDGTVAFALGSPDRPTDVAVVRAGGTVRLTHLNDVLADRKLARLSSLAVTALDGTPIDAWMLTPPDFDRSRKWPMILEIHGGPFLSYGPFFSTDDQLYAAAGYVVVYANERGSTSYGDVFANGIDRDFPGVDYDDLMRVTDAAVATGVVDPARLFVTGGSSGGIMTAWIVGKTHRFRAAVAQRPAVDWTSEVLTSDSGTKIMRNWIGRPPWQDPEGYWKHSPLSLIGSVTTPTLVIVGDRDVRTPQGEAEQLYGALQFQGVPTGLIKVPRAFHEMAERPSHSAAKAEATIAWFARYK